MNLIPLTLREANDFVARHHRHSRPVAGHRFSIGLEVDGNVVGAAIVGRPVARGFDDGFTAEVTRLCVLEGVRNACSRLYAACWRAWRAMGGRRIITYIRETETGTSIRAAGWVELHSVRGRPWGCQSRPRVERNPAQGKICFGASSDTIGP